MSGFGKNIIVVGDACADVYVIGDCKRQNPETSAPLLNQNSVFELPGMSLNVAENLKLSLIHI